jgi:GAF domain-containing protein
MLSWTNHPFDAGYVIRSKVLTNVSYPAVQHPCFNPVTDKLAGWATDTILCAPVWHKNRVYAAISIFNKRPEEGQKSYDAVFDVVDREFVHVLLAGVGKIIRNCQAFQEWNYMCNNSQLLSNLTTFFASDKSDVYNVLNVFLQRVRILLDAHRATLFMTDVTLPPEERTFITGFFGSANVNTISGTTQPPKDTGSFLAASTTGSAPFKISRGLAWASCAEKAVVNIPDAWEDHRFDNSFDLKTGFRTRSMLVVPILSRRNELLGCCQLINKGQEGDVFTQSDINFVQVFSAQASLGIENSFENLRLGKHLLYPRSKEQADEELQSTLEVAQSSTVAERILIWQVDGKNSLTFPFKNVRERFDISCVFALKDKVCSGYEAQFSIALSSSNPSFLLLLLLRCFYQGLPTHCASTGNLICQRFAIENPNFSPRFAVFILFFSYPSSICPNAPLHPQVRRDHRI